MAAQPAQQARGVQAGRYALTGQARRSQEAVAAAVKLQEPVLLVGETGSGKTSLLQQLATQVYRSQQTLALLVQIGLGMHVGAFACELLGWVLYSQQAAPWTALT